MHAVRFAEEGADIIAAETSVIQIEGVTYASARPADLGETVNTANHGVVGLTRYYAVSLAEKNIRVNTVLTASVNTRSSTP